MNFSLPQWARVVPVGAATAFVIGAVMLAYRDLTTLRVPVYLVANKKLSAERTRALMNVRRDLITDFPGLAQISKPSDDKDAFIPIHPGAAAYYDDSEQGFFEKYGDLLVYGPMVIGAVTSAAIAAWKFLDFGGKGPRPTPLDPLLALTQRGRGGGCWNDERDRTSTRVSNSHPQDVSRCKPRVKIEPGVPHEAAVNTGWALAISGGHPVLFATSAVSQPLPSWNDGAAKTAILDFVARVTRDGGPDYVKPEERVAVFDNDGTLWSEQPMYVQLAFLLDRIKALAPKNPQWKKRQPFKAALDRDLKTLAASGEKGLVELVAVTHGGMTTDEFSQTVLDWLSRARHPRFNKPYTELVFQPMLEVLAHLRANGFKTFIVSGGGFEFMRPWAEKVYGIPPEQVVGSSGVTKFEIGADGKPVLIKLPKIEFVDDGPGKPVAINRFIGRRPIFAFGNSDGDLPMLQWTAVGNGLQFMGIVHHTDAEREWAYDRKSATGKLDKALDEGAAKGWTIVDMKREWRTIYPFQK